MSLVDKLKDFGSDALKGLSGDISRWHYAVGAGAVAGTGYLVIDGLIQAAIAFGHQAKEDAVYPIYGAATAAAIGIVVATGKAIANRGRRGRP